MPLHRITIRLDKARNTYHQGECLSGRLVLDTKYELRHEGVLLSLEGFVDVSANLRGANLLLDTFSGTTRSLPLVGITYELLKPGRLEPGETVLPFKLLLDGTLDAPTLFETYHGVYLSIQYFLKCRVKRPLFCRDLLEAREIVIEYDPQPIGAPAHLARPVHFEITPESLSPASASSRRVSIPDFRITGRLDSAVGLLSEPITGEFTICHCQAPIRSIELQLVRVETFGAPGVSAPSAGSLSAATHSQAGGRGSKTPRALEFSRDATEVQNIQIGDGDLMRNVPISIYMVLPRLFTCPTLIADAFRIEFELNLVIIFNDNHMVGENFPIKLIRSTLQPINSGV